MTSASESKSLDLVKEVQTSIACRTAKGWHDIGNCENWLR